MHSYIRTNSLFADNLRKAMCVWHKFNIMKLKEKIEIFLKARNKTLKDLAEYIEISEEHLIQSLTDKTLEVRTLEQISKALRIPLFSFFHYPASIEQNEQIRYYNMKLPDSEEIDYKSPKEELLSEIEILKIQLHDREETLKQLGENE